MSIIAANKNNGITAKSTSRPPSVVYLTAGEIAKTKTRPPQEAPMKILKTVFFVGTCILLSSCSAEFMRKMQETQKEQQRAYFGGLLTIAAPVFLDTKKR